MTQLEAIELEVIFETAKQCKLDKCLLTLLDQNIRISSFDSLGIEATDKLNVTGRCMILFVYC